MLTHANSYFRYLRRSGQIFQITREEAGQRALLSSGTKERMNESVLRPRRATVFVWGLKSPFNMLERALDVLQSCLSSEAA